MHPRTRHVFLSIFLGFSLFLALPHAAGQATAEGSAGDTISAALAELKAGKTYESLWRLRRILARDPHLPEGHASLAAVYAELAEYEVAANHLRKAIELRPQERAYRNQLALILIDERKKGFFDSLSGFIGALQGRPGGSGHQVWRYLGSIQQQLSQWDEAIRTFEAALGAQPQDADNHISRARVYFVRGRFDDGIRELDAAVVLDPDRQDAQTLLGLAYSHSGWAPEATEAFRKAVKLDPEDQTASYRLAQNLKKLGRHEQARNVLQSFIRLQTKTQTDAASNEIGSRRRIAFKTLRDPRQLLLQAIAAEPVFVPALYSNGFALLGQGKYKEALASWADAARRDPLTADTFLSDAHSGASNLAQALEAAKRAVARSPEDPEQRLLLGEIYLAQDQPDEARQAFEQALARNNRLFRARLHLGGLALQEGKLNAALDHLAQAVEVSGDHSEAHRVLGEAYWQDGQQEKAIEQYKVAIQSNPSDERLRLALANALMSKGDFVEVEGAFKAAIQTALGSGQAHYQLARLYSRRGKTQEALDGFQKALELEPVVAADQLHRRIGHIYQTQAKLDDAIAAYEKALEISPNRLETHADLAGMYLRLNRYDEALAELLAALAIDPKDAEAYASIGQAYLRTGRYADAVAAARHALQLHQHHRQALYTLGNALMRLGRIEEGQKELRKFQELQAKDLGQQHRERTLAALQQEARAYFEKGEYDSAVGRIQQAVHQARQAGQVVEAALLYLDLGGLLFKAARYEEAIDSLKKAVELKVDAPEVHRYLGEAYERLGNLEEGRKHRAIYARVKEARVRKSEQR